MEQVVHQPIHSSLAPYIRKIFILRGEFMRGMQSRVLPTGSLQILIHFSDKGLNCDENGSQKINRSKASLIGQRTKFSLFSTEGPVEILGIEFFPHNASIFFEEPISEFTLESPLLSDIWKGNQLLEKIIYAGNDLTRFTYVQEELLRRLKPKENFVKESELLFHIINQLKKREDISIEKLGKEFDLHQRKMERLFLRHIGISPISYARILRIEKASRMISQKNGFNSLDFALENGFYDQAHFNRDFKCIVGISPTEFASSIRF